MQFSPRGSFDIFVVKCQGDEGSNGGVSTHRQFQRFRVGFLVDLVEDVVRVGLDEGVVAVLQQIGDTTSCPYITFE